MTVVVEGSGGDSRSHCFLHHTFMVIVYPAHISIFSKRDDILIFIFAEETLFFGVLMHNFAIFDHSLSTIIIIPILIYGW